MRLLVSCTAAVTSLSHSVSYITFSLSEPPIQKFDPTMLDRVTRPLEEHVEDTGYADVTV